MPLKPYVENWVREFYIAYGNILLEKRKRGPQETREVVRIKGVDVCYDEMIMNELLG